MVELLEHELEIEMAASRVFLRVAVKVSFAAEMTVASMDFFSADLTASKTASSVVEMMVLKPAVEWAGLTDNAVAEYSVEQKDVSKADCLAVYKVVAMAAVLDM